jgi:XRE family transcriptional regulator, regulator of sulfur utilization
MASKSRRPRKRTVGERVARLRDERGLTQAELASKAGVFRETLADIERGASQPKLETLMRLAAALRVPIIRLIQPGR